MEIQEIYKIGYFIQLLYVIIISADQIIAKFSYQCITLKDQA